MATALDFKHHVHNTASKAALALMGSDRGKKAAARMVLAFAQAASVAKDPQALYNCSGESIVTCVTTSIELGIYPGGPYPKAYLVPRGGQLQFEVTHRGIAVIAQRAGYSIKAVPVQKDEHVVISFGEVQEHIQDPDTYPDSLDDLRGVYVVLTRLKDGVNMGRAWVPISLIQKRANSRQAGPVWKQWPIEMAQKTAIKYCVARGALVIDSDELDQAISVSEVVVDQELQPAPPTTEEVLGQDGDRPALPDPDSAITLPLATEGSPDKEPVPVETKPATTDGEESTTDSPW